MFALCLLLAVVEWLRTQQLALRNPNWSFSVAGVVWHKTGFDAVQLAAVAGVIYGITKLSWSHAVQRFTSLAVAAVLPPAFTVGSLLIGCYTSGDCL
jgi:hypothetical protein